MGTSVPPEIIDQPFVRPSDRIFKYIYLKILYGYVTIIKDGTTH